MIYRCPRYSVDLDFNFNQDRKLLSKIFHAATSGLKKFGIIAEIRDEKLFQLGYTFDLSYQGPLYMGKDKSKGKIKIDVSLRQESTEFNTKIIEPEYPDIPAFPLTVVTLKAAMSGKMRALLVRAKPRDLFDVWFLLEKGVKINTNDLNDKLKLYDLKYSKTFLKKQIKSVSAQEWEYQLQPLLYSQVDLKAVQKRCLGATVN